MQIILFAIIGLFILAGDALAAEEKIPTCTAMDRPCLMKQIEVLAPNIEQRDWKDQTLRELAKTYTYENQPDRAIALIAQIENNDTKAMTIRGIGMAAATKKWDRAKYEGLFQRLSKEAEKITHPPSQGIAYTYIAMAQAFAGLDDDARRTASLMMNTALRNKAYGETSEIEADRGDIKNALISLAAVDSLPYRNKAYDTVSKIFLDKGMVEEAYTCASKIENAYIRAKSVQRILNKGNAEEADMEPAEDLSKGYE